MTVPIDNRFFILPWAHLSDQVENIAQERITEAEREALLGSARVSVRDRRDLTAAASRYQRGAAPTGVEGLPYDPQPFVPDEDRTELNEETLRHCAAMLDVITSATADIGSEEDLLPPLIAAFLLGAAYEGLGREHLTDLLRDTAPTQHIRAKQMAALREAVDAGRSAESAAVPVVRGGTRVSATRSASPDEAHRALLAAIDRVERATACLIDRLILALEEHAKVRYHRI